MLAYPIAFAGIGTRDEGAVPSFEGNAEMLDQAGNGLSVNSLGILAKIFCVIDI